MVKFFFVHFIDDPQCNLELSDCGFYLVVLCLLSQILVSRFYLNNILYQKYLVHFYLSTKHIRLLNFKNCGSQNFIGIWKIICLNIPPQVKIHSLVHIPQKPKGFIIDILMITLEILLDKFHIFEATFSLLNIISMSGSNNSNMYKVWYKSFTEDNNSNIHI